MDSHGNIIDPYHGEKDLKKRVFRHVSPAFSEDPVRILRVARFAARYSHLGFSVAEETLSLMKKMVNEGETDHLVAERVWAELIKALSEKTPSAFFYTLKQCDALQSIFPEIDQLFGIPQPAAYHPEVDTGLHSLLSLEQACILSPKTEVRLAALLHDLGKAATDKNKWPSHHGHEKKGLPLLENFCDRLRIPKNYKTLALQVMNYHTHCHRCFELKATTLIDMLTKLNAFKPSNNTINDFVLACEADSKGRTGLENKAYPQAEYLQKVAKVACDIDTTAILNSDYKGAEIGEAIRKLRINAVKKYIKSV